MKLLALLLTLYGKDSETLKKFPSFYQKLKIKKKIKMPGTIVTKWNKQSGIELFVVYRMLSVRLQDKLSRLHIAAWEASIELSTTDVDWSIVMTRFYKMKIVSPYFSIEISIFRKVFLPTMI